MQPVPQVNPEQFGQVVGTGIMGLMLGMGLIWLLVFLVIYLYFGFIYMTLAKKTNTENS